MKTSLWLNVDPLTEKYYMNSAYTYCFNNPINYIDPDGMQVDTDYTVVKEGKDKGKIVRADPNDGSEKNATDRILKTDKKGNVKTRTEKNSDGKKSKVAKVAVNNIAKGIISEGMNMRTDNQVIPFGKEGQPTLNNVVDFLVQYSQNVGNAEIAGHEAIDRKSKQNYILTYKYEGNDFRTSYSFGYGLNIIVNGTMLTTAHFHTHPNNTGLPDDINKPSPDDEKSKFLRNRNGNGGELPHYIYNIHGRIKY